MATTVQTLVSLPNAKLPLLAGDGTLTLPWRLFFQNLYTRSGGSSGGDTPDLNQIIEELAAVTITANDALSAAEDAQTAADQGALLGQVAAAEGDPATTGVSVLDFLGPTSLDSVVSVGLSAPAIFSVSGSPVTSSGTLALTLAAQTANLVWAGPSSGGAAAPAFRSLVVADIPTGLPYDPSGTAAGDIAGLLAGSNVWTGPNTFSGTLTGTLTGNASTATKWATARTLSFTGDATGSGSVDGSANVATALTLPTVNANVGSFGSASQVATFTVNAKGLTTAAGSVTITPAAIGALALTGGTLTGALNVNPGSITLPTAGSPLFSIAKSGGSAFAQQVTYGGTVGLLQYTAGGTSASPSAVASGVTLGQLAVFGYTGSAFAESANLSLTASQNWTSSAQGTGFGVILTKNNTTAQYLAFQVQNNGTILTTSSTVANLPSASASLAAARYFVSDATTTTFGSVVAGGGTNPVPVYSDGTNWRIG
jgi:hypothetical protein